MANVLIVGTQWGDEGKGKIVDLISEHFDLITRHQGGHNAGHTVYVGPRKFILTLVPSGIIRPGKKAVIGNGLVINPAHLLKEIETLEGLGVEIRGNLFVSNRAHVIFPYHPMMERATEAIPGKVPIGTTSRGIGPCYEDKSARRGLRLADLLDTETFPDRFRAVAEEKNAILKALGIYEPWDIGEVCRQYLEYAERLRPFVCDTAQVVSNAVRKGQTRSLRGRSGGDARYRPRYLPVCDLLERYRRRGLHRPRRLANRDRRCCRHRQSLRYARGRRPRFRQKSSGPTRMRCANTAESSAPSPDGRAVAAGSICRCRTMSTW